MAKPYPDVQKLPRNGGSSFFIFEFSFSLLSYFRSPCDPPEKKKNSWKNLIFHIFCFINKLCKMRKFAKFTLVISHVRLVCDIYCAHAYLCRYHSALFCFRKMKLRGLIFLINCGSNLTINIVKRGKKMKSK